MKKFMLVVACLMFVGQAIAVVSIDDGDHTTPPSDDRGWKYICQVGTYSFKPSVVIGPRHILSTAHARGNVGDTVTFLEQQYTIDSVTISPDWSDVAICTVTSNFPTNSWAKLLTKSLAPGMEITMFGNGPSKGEPIYRTNVINVPASPLLITNFVRNQAVKFDVARCLIGTKFVVQQTTNPVSDNWVSLPTHYVASCDTVQVELTDPSPMMYYRTMSLSNTVTNSTLIGWMAGVDAPTQRWGTNTIHFVDVYNFGSVISGGSCTVPGDSSGGCFAVDENGEWNLAGVNQSSDTGPFSVDGGQTWFRATMLDMAGLSHGIYNYSTGEITFGWQIGTLNVYPQISTYARINTAWVESIINQ